MVHITINSDERAASVYSYKLNVSDHIFDNGRPNAFVLVLNAASYGDMFGLGLQDAADIAKLQIKVPTSSQTAPIHCRICRCGSNGTMTHGGCVQPLQMACHRPPSTCGASRRRCRTRRSTRRVRSARHRNLAILPTSGPVRRRLCLHVSPLALQEGAPHQLEALHQAHGNLR